jgi:hypothetical protein
VHCQLWRWHFPWCLLEVNPLFHWWELYATEFI